MQSGGEKTDNKVQPKAENRLSFDFCELNADQLLESTPQSYGNEYRSNQKNPKQFVFN